MTPSYKRWWRWFTNPMPMPGEVWRVDGIGAVEVVAARETPRWDFASPYGIHFRTQGGEMLRWTCGAFLSRALPGAPSPLLTMRDHAATADTQSPDPYLRRRYGTVYGMRSTGPPTTPRPRQPPPRKVRRDRGLSTTSEVS